MGPAVELRPFAKAVAARWPLLMDLYLFARAPKAELPVWLDLWRTRRTTGFLRRPEIATRATEDVVLIPLLGGWVYEIKMQLMFATALRLQGWRVVVLSESRRATRAYHYSKAFGIEEVVSHEDIPLSQEGLALCDKAATEFMAGPLTFQSVKSWMFQGSWIGPQILGSVSRTQFRGAPDPSDPAIRSEIAEQLPKVLRGVLVAAKVMDSVRPRLMTTLEANYARHGPLVDMAVRSGIDVIHYNQITKDDSVVLKRLTAETRRTHMASVARETLDFLENEVPWNPQREAELWSEFADRYGGRWRLQNRNQRGTRKMDREEIASEVNLRPGKKIAVLFSHILWDANIFYGEDLFNDYGEWFVRSVAAACANPKVDWLIKLHPANVWKRAYEGVTTELSELQLINSEIGSLPDHVHLLPPDTNISTLSLYESADYGVTVRGTPGMEMACFGKAVFTAGTGRYSHLGFTIDSSSADEYLRRLAAIQTYEPPTADQIRLARRHAHAVFRLRLWQMKSFQSRFNFERDWHPLDHNVGIAVRSIEEIRKTGDLEKWVTWAAGSRRVDYLELPPSAVPNIDRNTELDNSSSA